MPKGVPLTEEGQQRRRHEIFYASVALFLQKGFQETSMREIARAARVGKSTLYDYFETKDEILASFVEDQISDLMERAKAAVDQNRPSEEKLRQVILAHMQYLIDNREVFFKLSFEVQRLPMASQQRMQDLRHEYQDLLCRLIDDAVREGSFRPVNSLLAARTILALLPTAIYTTRPTGTTEQMVNEVMDIFYHGVMNQHETVLE